MEELVISADSHVIEVPDLWEKGMPQKLRDRAPRACEAAAMDPSCAFVPFIPGLRSIPRWIPLHRLIWLDYYRNAKHS